MTYDSDRPPDWTTYDRVASASADIRDILHMHGVPARLQMVLGPNNFHRMIEMLDCIDINLKKMGRLGLRWATEIITYRGTSTEDTRCLRALRKYEAADKINEGWNRAEAWATDTAKEESSLIKVNCDVTLFEIDGKDAATDNKRIQVNSHWNRPALVVLVVDGKSFTVAADDLKAAIANATNTSR